MTTIEVELTPRELGAVIGCIVSTREILDNARKRYEIGTFKYLDNLDTCVELETLENKLQVISRDKSKRRKSV